MPHQEHEPGVDRCRGKHGCGRRFGDRGAPADTAMECRPAEQRVFRSSPSGRSAAWSPAARGEGFAARRSTPHPSCRAGRPAWSRRPNTKCRRIPVSRLGNRECRNRDANSGGHQMTALPCRVDRDAVSDLGQRRIGAFPEAEQRRGLLRESKRVHACVGMRADFGTLPLLPAELQVPASSGVHSLFVRSSFCGRSSARNWENK